MIINDLKIVAYKSEETRGYDRDGQEYRARTIEINWPDEDEKREHRCIARLRTQACEIIEQRGIALGERITADLSFNLSTGHSGYQFNNVYINKIL